MQTACQPLAGTVAKIIARRVIAYETACYVVAAANHVLAENRQTFYANQQ